MVWKYGDDDGKWSKVITMLLGSGRSVEVSAVIVRRFFSGGIRLIMKSKSLNRVVIVYTIC